ncbi:hypothetical protein [Streptomyces triticiradicis]|uniref:Uncharacterized protein n=1 Tax=Streptomyces triticiradicis TaxID=2651189 RepID=A0A7J5DI33_9ACTN|nr:hypothetical protein [Streptomyces triticiradicis]KAB1988312.1 hypothetical protein F8144_14030 [Streptomyces triticiradicis]
MNALLSLVKRLLLFAGVAALASLILPQLGVVVTRNTSYATAIHDNWDATAAVSGLLLFGALEVWWGCWLLFTVSGGMVDSNIPKGMTSLLVGVALVVVAAVVLTTTVFP